MSKIISKSHETLRSRPFGRRAASSATSFNSLQPKKTHAESPDGLAGTPDLLVVDLVELFLQVLAVGLARVEVERAAGLGTILDRLVEGLKDGQVGPGRSALSPSLGKTARTHSLNLGAQSRAPRRAVVEQALYM